jgi:hypothetical protein
MDVPFPAETARLDPCGRLFIWSFRHWIVGHKDERHWSLVWRELSRRFGNEAASEAVTALSAVVRTICEHARRNVTYHQPCCPCLASDEYRVVAFVAACRRADWPVAGGLAEWIVLRDGVGDLVSAGARLAKLFETRSVLTDAVPAHERDDAPYRFDDAEWPGALQEAID